MGQAGAFLEDPGAALESFLLLTGGYVAGTSLSGAPLMVAVYTRYVSPEQLRNTLFVLWFTLVAIKMSAFAALGVEQAGNLRR